MTSILLELQKDALDPNIALSDLLRKARLIAHKLKTQDFEEWIKKELEGYSVGDQIPEYRKIGCQIKENQPYHDWQPINPEGDEPYRILSPVQVDVLFPIFQIEKMPDDSIEVEIPFPRLTISLPQKEIKANVQIGRFVPKIALDTIVDIIRTNLLEWTIKLEDQGIVGEGLTFTEKETIKAKEIPQINIKNFNGILGDITNSPVVQTQTISVQKKNFESLKNYLKEIGIENDDIDELQTAIKTDPVPDTSEHFGEKVGSWIGRMIGKASTGAWQITVNTASGLLTQMLLKYYGF